MNTPPRISDSPARLAPFTLITFVVAVVVAPSLVSSPAVAQAPSDASGAITRERFNKGVAAYKEQRFSDAASEFAAAYKASPNAFKILFNIGQVSVALGRPVEAVDAYDKYLKQGGATIPAERRKEVQIEIDHQLAHIGTLVVRTLPEGADVRIDGSLVGKSPLPRALRLAEGRHTVEAILAGHAVPVREVDVAGRAEAVIELTLDSLAVPEPSRHPEGSPVAAPPPVPAVPAVVAPPPVARSESPPSPPQVWTSSSASPAQVTSSTNWQRVIGCVVVVGGLATATVGGLMAYKASNDVDAASERLSNATTDAAYDAARPDFDAAKKRNQLGWTVTGIGAAVLAGGILLVATAPEKSSTVAFGPWTTARGAGLSVAATW